MVWVIRVIRTRRIDRIVRVIGIIGIIRVIWIIRTRRIVRIIRVIRIIRIVRVVWIVRVRRNRLQLRFRIYRIIVSFSILIRNTDQKRTDFIIALCSCLLDVYKRQPFPSKASLSRILHR